MANKGTGNYYGVPLTLQDWVKIEQGLKPDHFNLDVVLKDFNNQVSCGGKNYNVTTQACGDKKDCEAILTSSFTPPSCVTDKDKANVTFTQLKSYITETQSNAQNLQFAIGNNNKPDTVAGQLYFSREFFYTFQS